MEQELYKTRSAAACVKAAYRFIYEQRRAIFLKMWLPALLCAIAVAMTIVPNLKFTGLLLVVVAALWYYARLFTLLNGQQERKNGFKILKSYSVCLVLSLLTAILVAAAVFGLQSLLPPPTPEPHCGMYFVGYIAIAGIVGCVIAQLLAGLPLSFFFMKYMIEDISVRRELWPAFKTGLRHWGQLFLVGLIVWLVLLPICVIVVMPLIVLGSAQLLSGIGVVMGDEAGLPASFLWMMVLSTVLVYFIVLLLCIWPVISYYYAYGSIRQQEEDRRAMAATDTPDD